MIKNIIFDMGQVLIKFDPDYFLERVGVTDESDKLLLKRKVYQSLEWARMDRGSLDEESASKLMCEKLPERLHEYVRKLTIEWCRPIIEIDGISDIVRKLKEKGYKIYLLSNAGFGQKNYWNSISCSKYFDGRLVSAEEGLVKPQPEIYRLLCDRYSLKPEECVFIDDSVQNAEGAYYCGITPIVFHGDAKELTEELKKLNIEIE